MPHIIVNASASGLHSGRAQRQSSSPSSSTPYSSHPYSSTSVMRNLRMHGSSAVGDASPAASSVIEMMMLMMRMQELAADADSDAAYDVVHSVGAAAAVEYDAFLFEDEDEGTQDDEAEEKGAE